MTPANKKSIVGAVIQARLGSSRFPGKVLQPLADKPLLGHVIERLRQCKRLDKIVVATTTAEADRALLAFAEGEGVLSFAGSEDDVLDRFLGAARAHHLDIVVRICSDSPLIDWELIDRMIENLIEHRADYAICDETIAHACEGYEVATLSALKKTAQLSDKKSDREHVTIYIRKHTKQFAVLYQPVPKLLQGEYRLSIDVAADLEFMRAIYDTLYQPGKPIDVRDAIRWLKRHPDVLNVNAHVKQKPVTAITKHVLVLADAASFAGRSGKRAEELLKNLAEHYHCVLTIAAPLPPEELTRFGALGYRTVALPVGEHPTQKSLLELVEHSQAKMVLYAGEMMPPPLHKKLERNNVTLTSLDAPHRQAYKAVVQTF